MRYISTGFLLILSLGFSVVCATENTLAPNIQIALTPTMKEFGAFSFMGEIGEKNFRGSGTYGVYFTPCQRFKLSGEFLSQKLKYHYTHTETRKWVSQYALGTQYQYLFPSSFIQSIDLGGAYSHAFDRNVTHSIRRIAGSDGGYGFLGTTINLWTCALLSTTANYDYVKYHRKYEKNELANGWGGSVRFVQRFAEDFALQLTSEFRKPFNFYEAELLWNHFYSYTGVDLGFYANFTDGHQHLPNVFAGGIRLGVSFGPNKAYCCRATGKRSSSQKCYEKAYCNLASWVSKPAVYMPIVLAIADKHPIKDACTSNDVPTSTPIPFFLAPGSGIAFTIPTKSYFSSSSPLTFSATGLPPEASINPETGVISIPASSPKIGSITVTATNQCGSTSQTFEVLYPS